MKAYEDFNKICERIVGEKGDCPYDCKYSKRIEGEYFNCFARYLEEEIEVPIENY